MAKNNKSLGIILLAGAGGVLAWYLLKDKLPPPINPKGFVLFAEPFYKQNETKIKFPFPGINFDIIVMAINKSWETIDCYCDIISDSETVFSESISANHNDIKSFTYTTMMLETEMNFTIELGRIIDLEKVKDYSINIKVVPGEEPVIPPGVSAEFISTGFMQV